MNDKPEERLIWEGQTTLTALRGLVEARINFELQLAPDYHYALFRHLYPDATAGEPEWIDMHGGAELLERIAEIHGLNELAELAAPIAAAGGSIHIQSPSPGISVSFTTEPAS